MKHTATRAPSASWRRARSLLVAACMALTCAVAGAQGRSVTVPAQPTLEQVNRHLKDAEGASSLPEEERKIAVDLYREARNQLTAANEDLDRARQLEEAAKRAPAAVEEIRAKLGKPAAAVSAEEFASVPVERLEAELRTARADMQRMEAQLASLREEVERLTAAPRALRETYAQAEQALERTVDKPLPEATPDAEQAARARALAAGAERRAIAARTERLRTELLTLDARLALATARRDLASRELADLAARVQALEKALGGRRAQEAAKTRRDAEQAEAGAADKHPLVREAAARNAELAGELASVVTAQIALAERRAAVEAQLQRVIEEYQNAQQRVSLAGLSSALGQVLREQRRALPSPRALRARARGRDEAMAKVGLAQLRVDDALQELADPGKSAEQRVTAEQSSALDDAARRALAKELAALMEARRDLLRKLREARHAQFTALSELEFEERRLADRSRAFAGFLDEHLLWIPSTEALDLGTLQVLPRALAWLVLPEHLSALIDALREQAARRPVMFALLAVAVWLLVRIRPALRRQLADAAQAVQHAASDRFEHTAMAVGSTALLALPVALATAFVAWRLGTGAEPESYVAAVSEGLLAACVPLFLLRVFRFIYHQNGLATAHFGWSEAIAAKMRRHLRALLLTVVPGVFVVRTMEAQPDLAMQSSAGRLAFVALTLAIAGVLYALLHPRRGLLTAYLLSMPETWLSRLRHVWYLLAVGIPLTLAGLALSGYYYTAIRLNEHQTATLRLIIAAVVAYQLVLRALRVARRRLALKSAAEAAAAQARTQEESADGPAVHVSEPGIDIDAINTQTLRLARIVVGWAVVVGLYLIWADVLPALGILDDVVLWDSASVVDGAPVVQHITLADISLALVFGIVFAVAARNVPGVLEIALLQHLPMDAGTRYAVTTISQYVIVAAGIVFIFQSMGVGWGQVQWLVAALGVGLGFGLQEIFANFISGLIILFERPVRIGDTVTLGELTGTVTRIRIRATTVTDWDNKELIIPNKSFITDRLINWTLSDSIMRVKIPVGIAYGSDTTLAFEVISKVAKDNPRVLDEPAMQVLFLGFGDSALNFELRVFVGQLSDLIKVTHELHMAINQALKENGIEIAFPQRDLHIRSMVAIPQGESERGAQPEDP